MQEINVIGESGNYSSRHGARVRLWVLHTEEGNQTARGLHEWMIHNQVSYHYVGRGGLVLDVIDTDYSAWAALDANPFSIHFVFAGSKASQTRSQWLNRYAADIDNAARLFVQDARKYDPLTPIVIGHDEIRAGHAGGTDHYGITVGLGIGSHTDVGPGFPWDVYAAAVRKYADGYVAPEPVPVRNAIDAEAEHAAGWIGARVTEGELDTPDGRGKYASFEHGAIYWTPTTGAHAIPANVFETWAELGFEAGPLGYPIGPHTVLGDLLTVGDVQGFEHGAIYRRYDEPGYFVTGRIRERWNRNGFENGPLGWPISNETPTGDGSVVQAFEHGRISWSPDGTTALQAAGEPDVILPETH